MKDFNIIKIAGIVFNKEDLKNKSTLYKNENNWEGDFWNFIAQWINDNNYILVKSSGSTSAPKTIKILKEKMLASAAMTCSFLKLQKDDTALLCMSTKHIGGMMMVVRAIYAELNLFISEPKANALNNFNQPIDFTAMVPYQAHTCINESLEKTKQIKSLIIGGGKVSSELENLIKKHDINAYSTFGMTETISHIALQLIGKETHYTCLDNIEIEKSEENTLIINAPSLLKEKLKTNDIIHLISNKEFNWLGRKDFAIETGGIKILPEVVEKKIEKFITKRFIISYIPSIKFNNEVVLIIESAPFDLDKNVFKNLNKFEKPKKIFFQMPFIETANGKLNRNEIRKSIL